MVVAGLARERGFALNALTIDYNQRHRREIDAAREIAARWARPATSSCRSTCASSAVRR